MDIIFLTMFIQQLKQFKRVTELLFTLESTINCSQILEDIQINVKLVSTPYQPCGRILICINNITVTQNKVSPTITGQRSSCAKARPSELAVSEASGRKQK